MTGYARAQGSDERRRWVWEARSVNGRNLEIRCRVPQGFDRLENPARTAIGNRMKRGSVSNLAHGDWVQRHQATHLASPVIAAIA